MFIDFFLSGTLSVEEICNDQIKFANLIRELAAKDLDNMGIDIVSLTINNIYDNVDYLDSLGRTRIAQVKQDAQIKIIESERDIRIIENECQQQSINQSLISKIKIETAKQQYEVKKFEYDCELNRQKTETELAYELQSIKIQQIQRLEEKKIELIKKQKSIQLEQLESELINQKLISDVRLPADNESDRIRIEAKAGKNVHLMMAIAEMEKIQQIGLAKVDNNKLYRLHLINNLKNFLFFTIIIIYLFMICLKY